MPDIAEAYRGAREAMTRLGRALDDAGRARMVPACPEWTVTDLLTHVTSLAATLVAGQIPTDLNLAMIWDPEISERREELVETRIAEREGRSLDEILDEWEAAGATVESMMRGETPAPSEAPPFWDWILMTDLGVHLHDLRGALGEPGDRDSLATGLSARSYVESMRFRSAAEGFPPFRIVAGSREWVTGEEEPVATLTIEPFELQRAASGRRSPDQVRALDWDGDPEPLLPLFYPYGPREDALVE